MTAQHPDQLDLEGLESARASLADHLDDFDRENNDDIDAEDFNIGQDEYIEVWTAHLRTVLGSVPPLLSRLRASEAECEQAKSDYATTMERLEVACVEWANAEALATSQAEIIKGLTEALERIEAATPYNTNSKSAAQAFSWSGAVASNALADALASTRTPAGSDEEVGT